MAWQRAHCLERLGQLQSFLCSRLPSDRRKERSGGSLPRLQVVGKGMDDAEAAARPVDRRTTTGKPA
eukprot:3662176-Prymnesium_polylepis.1